MTTYSHYDNAGRAYGLTSRQVAALVKKHNLPKRRIWSQMAVEWDAWDNAMKEEGRSLAPGYSPAKK